MFKELLHDSPYCVRFVYIFTMLIIFARFYNVLFVWTVDMLKTYRTSYQKFTYS